MNNSLIALVVGMFGSEFHPIDGKPIFGMRAGQMRSTEHPCTECGLLKSWSSRIPGPPQLVKSTGYHGGIREQYPLGRCHCTHFVPSCEKIGHNHGWFNAKGEKVGWGDTCVCDMKRIAAEADGIMYFLSEMDSHWEMQRNRDRRPTMTDIEYVREKAVWAIVPNHHIPRLPGGRIPQGQNMFNFININNYSVKVGKANTRSWGSIQYTEINSADLSVWGA